VLSASSKRYVSRRPRSASFSRGAEDGPLTRRRRRGSRRESIFDSSPRKKEPKDLEMTPNEIIRQLKARRCVEDEVETTRPKRPQSSHAMLSKRPMFMGGETSRSRRGMENMPPQRPQTAGGRASLGRGKSPAPLISRKIECIDPWEALGVITIDDDEDDDEVSGFGCGRQKFSSENVKESVDPSDQVHEKTRLSSARPIHHGHRDRGMGMGMMSSSQTAADIVGNRIEMLRASVKKKQSVWISDVKDCLVEVEIRKRVKRKSSQEGIPGHMIKGSSRKGEMYASYVDTVVAERIKRCMDQVGDGSLKGF
jgi:hypothetical protein